LERCQRNIQRYLGTRRGYTEEQIEKLWGGNLLRVMDEVQRIARELQK
jgi:membrane dipeptidase